MQSSEATPWPLTVLDEECGTHPYGFGGVLVDPDAPCFDHVYGYKPIVGGVRHLTALAARPPLGTVVEGLCGARYQVVARRRWRGDPDVRYDCSFCALAHTGIEP